MPQFLHQEIRDNNVPRSTKPSWRMAIFWPSVMAPGSRTLSLGLTKDVGPQAHQMSPPPSSLDRTRGPTQVLICWFPFQGPHRVLSPSALTKQCLASPPSRCLQQLCPPPCPPPRFMAPEQNPFHPHPQTASGGVITLKMPTTPNRPPTEGASPARGGAAPPSPALCHVPAITEGPGHSCCQQRAVLLGWQSGSVSRRTGGFLEEDP